ncbi:hypothetical protein EJ06DRAFT_525706 [Trichodelitschia bisporula]|uniref:Uncharacterized protein n=1 Tax=Trichodelitschia bisporula TaxID=703511 RepID=A0A6G1IA52_9PEZI|nr:hypothetical protein EJ06DRAFT_525706 [Trichodelitschia bisporula]
MMLSKLLFVIQLCTLWWGILPATNATYIPKGGYPGGKGGGGGKGGHSAQPNFTFDEMWKMQTKFWDAFMYPNNVAEAKSINSSLLAPNVLGRVDVTRTFDGPELNTEYLFGLFATLALNPGATTLLGYPVSYEIVHFAASQNIASASTIIMFNLTSVARLVPIEIDTWNMWNAQGQVVEYDATFRWFQFFFDNFLGLAMPLLGTTTPQQTITILQPLIATGICRTHTEYCTGENQQYDNATDCFNFLSAKTRFGTAYELGRDTLLCRMVHENMIPYRPEVHCPHIGPSGGGMCVDDTTYSQKVLEPYFTHAPFVPYGYASKNATIAAM